MLNSHSQRHHSAAEERETATPKESMTLDVQVNISKAATYTIACRLPALPPPLPFITKALDHTLAVEDLSAGRCYMVVYFPSM